MDWEEKSYLIDEVINKLSEKTGQQVFFDDSRMWTLGYKDKDSGEYFGAQRGYMGGGVRGSIRTHAPEDNPEYRDLFKTALEEIESIINSDTEGMESWEQNTGVLL